MENIEKKYLALEKELIELKKVNKTLFEISNNFDLLVNHMDDFVWITNKQLEITYVSPSVKNILGFTEREFLRKPIFDLGTSETKALITKAYADRREGKSDNKKKLWVTQVYHKNGILVWVETSTNPILNNVGEFDGILAVSRDITQKMIAENKMHESEANLIAQIENTTDSIWSVDDAYCIKTLNSNFKTNFQLAFGVELKYGTSIVNSLPEPFRAIWKERYDKALKGEHYTVTDHFEFEGVPQYVEVKFNPIIYNEKVIGVSVFSRDITAQKVSEQNLIESSANLSSLVEHTDARIWSIDLDYNIITINNNFRRDYEIAFRVNLKKGSYALENVPLEIFSHWKERYDKVLSGEQVSIIEHFEIEGVPQYVEVSLNPIRISEKVIGATCFSRDISQQKLAEIALKESEQRYKSLVANIPSTTYRCLADKNWTMKFLSAEILNLTGYPPHDFIDNKVRSYASIIHPEDAEYVEIIENEKLANKESYSIEYRINHKSGEIKWVHERGRGNFDENGNLKSIDGVISDITLRKIGEQELQDSELKFRILSDASIDLMSLNSVKEILNYLTDTLHKRLISTIIIAYIIDEQNQSTELVNISGLENNLFKKALEFLRFNPIGRKFKMIPSMEEIFRKGKLIKFEGGLADFSSRIFSKTTANTLQKILNISEIHNIGINREDKLLAGLNIISLNSKKLDDSNFIESFINLAGIVLQRQQLMEALHQSEDKFRSFFENTGSIISIETENKYLLTNRAFQSTFGYTAEESKLLKPSDLVHPLERDRISIQAKKRIKGEDFTTSYLLHAVDKNFNEKWLDISASVIDYEGQRASLLVGSDITERKKDELQLNKFSTGIMNSPSSIVITDIDGTIEYVNPFFSEFTGYSFDEAVGNNPRILQSGKTPIEVFQDLWSTILKGEVWNGEFLNKKKNGQFYWETARIAPIFDENGIITNFIAIKEDITERKRTLELMEQSEKDLRDINAKKDKFFSIIAHDLRSPFSGLLSLTDLMKNNIKELSDEEVETYLELINQSTQNIFKLLENLLAWAKTQTGKMEFSPVNLNLLELVTETVSFIDITAKNKGITIEVTIHKDTTVFADENMLNTVIRNLLSNALKYTNKGGKIKVFSEERTYNNKLFSIIGVSDNGVGIPKDKLGKIFNIEDNYTTTGTEKEKGTGLGLILCKEFVEKHEGKIWCKSEENHGSTFFFSLPKVDKTKSN